MIKTTVRQFRELLEIYPDDCEIVFHQYMEGEVYACDPEIECQNYNKRVWIKPGECIEDDDV
jgi:hypothetical protein